MVKHAAPSLPAARRSSSSDRSSSNSPLLQCAASWLLCHHSRRCASTKVESSVQRSHEGCPCRSQHSRQFMAVQAPHPGKPRLPTSCSATHLLLIKQSSTTLQARLMAPGLSCFSPKNSNTDWNECASLHSAMFPGDSTLQLRNAHNDVHGL
jgi:hypothetical protein